MSIDKRGRVVKDKRQPIRSAPKMGKNGIALVEYLGHSESIIEISIPCEDGNKNYFFSSRPAHKTQFMDKSHGDYLESIKGGDGDDLFRIIAQYSPAASKYKLEIKTPSDATKTDDLPSGFAPQRGKRSGTET